MSSKTSGAKAMRIALPALLMTLALSSAAHASAARTFVSSTGNDANASANCAISSPCRTFAGAYAVTNAGGQIVAIDSAGYGPVTITTSVSIIGALAASVTVPASGIGINIAAGASDRIIVRNLQIIGGGANTTGIRLTGGNLVLQNSTVMLLSTGLDVQNSKADAINTDIIGNTVGVSTTGTGVDTQACPQTGPTQVRIFSGSVIDNTTAFLMNDPGLRPSPATDNKITIFFAEFITNIVGNQTQLSGTGASCMAAANCKSIFGYTLLNGNDQCRLI